MWPNTHWHSHVRPPGTSLRTSTLQAICQPWRGEGSLGLVSFDTWSLPDGSVGKESACNVGDLGLIPGLGRFPGDGKGYPLQYSGLENSMDESMGSKWGHKWATFTSLHCQRDSVSDQVRRLSLPALPGVLSHLCLRRRPRNPHNIKSFLQLHSLGLSRQIYDHLSASGSQGPPSSKGSQYLTGFFGLQKQ